MIHILEIIFLFCSIPSIRAVSLRIDGLIDLGPNWSYEYRVLSPRDVQAKRDNSNNEGLPLATHPKYDLNDDERMRLDEERLRKAEERLRQEADQLRKAQMDMRIESLHKAESEGHKHRDKSETHHYHHPQIEFHKYHEAPVEEEEDHTIKTGHRNQEKLGKRHHSSHRTEEKHKKKKPKATEVSELLPEHSKNRFSEIIIQNGPNDSETKEPKHDKSVEIKHSKAKTTTTSTTMAKPSTWSSASEEDSSSDSSSMKTTKKAGTMFDMDDFTTTRAPKTPPTVEEETKKKKKHDDDNDSPMNEDVGSFSDEFIKHDRRPIKRDQLPSNNTGKTTNATTTTTVIVTNATVPTTTQVTTVRTADIYSNPHKVKEDEKVKEFTNHIYKQTLKVFDVIKQKTNGYHMRKQVDVIAKSYEEKFKEFLRETNNQKIKTRLGTQKVILNTIDMSNRILKRLINYMIGDMDKKGVLRHNIATANILQKEVEKEQSLELSNACKKFGICRSGSGFPEFLIDIFTITLKCDDRKFKQTIDAVTEVVKSTDFNRALEYRTEKKLKASMERIEQLGVYSLRPLFMILKNIITNKNKPLIITSASAGSQINSTLAFLEIIDLLDQNMPRNEANNLEWNDIKTSLTDYSESKRYDVQDIMETLMKHFKKTLRSLDSSSQKIISKNMNILIS